MSIAIVANFLVAFLFTDFPSYSMNFSTQKKNSIISLNCIIIGKKSFDGFVYVGLVEALVMLLAIHMERTPLNAHNFSFTTET